MNIEDLPPNHPRRRMYEDMMRPRGLDPTGALATLLAVTEVLPLADAANAVGLPEQALIDEALAWAVASEGE